MQLSNAENDLSEQLKELCVSADVLSFWKEMFFLPAELAKEARNEVLSH